MILHENRLYYPLDFGKMIKDGKVYYDRMNRKKNYFYLDLRTGARDVYQQENQENQEIGSGN